MTDDKKEKAIGAPAPISTDDFNKRKLAELNAKRDANDQKIDWAKKSFNIDDFLNDPNALEEKVIPGIGVVKFKRLTTAEMREFAHIKDEYHLSLRMFHKMLNKANPSVTLEKIMKMDPIISGTIMQHILGRDRLFLASQAQKP